MAEKTAIAGQDYILVGDRYRTTTVNNSSYPIVRLGDVCSINNQSRTPSNEEEFIYITAILSTISWFNNTNDFYYDLITNNTATAIKAARRININKHPNNAINVDSIATEKAVTNIPINTVAKIKTKYSNK